MRYLLPVVAAATALTIGTAPAAATSSHHHRPKRVDSHRPGPAHEHQDQRQLRPALVAGLDRQLRRARVRRGPYVAGRDYDLMEAVKVRLGFPGVGTVLANR